MLFGPPAFVFPSIAPRLVLKARMARIDFNAPRLHVAAPLAEGAAVALSPEQTNYLVNVLRLKTGARVLLFNGRDGEFAASLATAARRGASLTVAAQARPQEAPPDVDFLFAPLKHVRLDYLAQKAVEMGARRLRPVVTRRTQVARLNLERLAGQRDRGLRAMRRDLDARGLAARAARQGAGRWPAERLLVFCDEDAPQASPIDTLGKAKASAGVGVGLIIGPEGGFDEKERAAILAVPRVVRLSLGPRALRADTAAVAALALVQATLGDWPRPAR